MIRYYTRIQNFKIKYFHRHSFIGVALNKTLVGFGKDKHTYMLFSFITSALRNYNSYLKKKMHVWHSIPHYSFGAVFAPFILLRLDGSEDLETQDRLSRGGAAESTERRRYLRRDSARRTFLSTAEFSTTFTSHLSALL